MITENLSRICLLIRKAIEKIFYCATISLFRYPRLYNLLIFLLHQETNVSMKSMSYKDVNHAIAFKKNLLLVVANFWGNYPFIKYKI